MNFSILQKCLIGFFLLLMFLFSTLILGLGGYILALSYNVQDDIEFAQVESSIPSKLFDRNGILITEFFRDENRELMSLSQMPKFIPLTLMAKEDKNFFYHGGFSMKGYISAVKDLLLNQFVRGGSTITLQLAKQVYTDRESSIERKIKELFWALQLEKKLSKYEILERYLNRVNFGHGNYSIASATKFYFDKDVRDINEAEAATLMSVLSSPNTFTPVRRDNKTVQKIQNEILNVMISMGVLNEKQKEETMLYYWAVHSDLKEKKAGKSAYLDRIDRAPYFSEYLRFKLIELLDSEEKLYEGGYHIYTTLDLAMQEEADILFQQSLKIAGDNVSSDSPKPEGALIALEPKTGDIITIIGGSKYDYNNQFNRALQGELQPASTFKPLLYASGIEAKKITAGTVLLDAPIVYDNGEDIEDIEERFYTPNNYGNKFQGWISARVAIAISSNIPAIRALEAIGYDDVVENVGNLLGYNEEKKETIPRVPALALGTATVKPIDLVKAYAVFANEGQSVNPRSLLYINDRYGNNIYKAPNVNTTQVISKETAFIMTSILQDTLVYGTLRRSTDNFAPNLKPYLAGKTGTSQNASDAWAIGYSKDIALGIWFGQENKNYDLSWLTGSTLSGPLWAKFMKKYHQNKELRKLNETKPDDIISVEIQKETGLLPEYVDEERKRWEFFIKGTEPTEYSTYYSEREGEIDSRLNVISSDIFNSSVTNSWLNDPNDFDLNSVLEQVDNDLKEEKQAEEEAMYNSNLLELESSDNDELNLEDLVEVELNDFTEDDEQNSDDILNLDNSNRQDNAQESSIDNTTTTDTNQEDNIFDSTLLN